MPTSSYKQTQLFLVSLILCLISSLNGEINPISIKYNKSDLKKTLKELVDTYQIPLIYPSNIKDQKSQLIVIAVQSIVYSPPFYLIQSMIGKKLTSSIPSIKSYLIHIQSPDKFLMKSLKKQSPMQMCISHH